MKKILILSSRIPFPLIGGDRIRLLNNIRILSKKYEVDLLFINNRKTCQNDIKELKKYCINIYNFDFPKIRFIINTFFGLVSNKKPLQVNYYYFKKIEQWVNTHIEKYQLIFCNHIRMTEYVKDYKKIIKIVDYVDSIAMNYNEAYKKTNGIWKIIYKIEQGRIAKYEVEISKKFDKKLITSKIDRKYIEINGGSTDIEVIPHFVKVDKIQKKDSSTREKNRISFLGKMDYEPNVNAVNYFMNEVYQDLINKIPDIEFYIIGAQPTREVKKYALLENVKVTGFLEEPLKVLCESKIFIAPMISGSGVQTKILEAMSLGMCVITTKLGAEGLEKLSGKELVIVKDKKEMLDSIIQLIKREEKRNQIGLNAKKYIEKNLTEKNISKKLIQYLEEE